MWDLLIALVSFMLGLAIFCVFPIRNSIACRGRPWATYGLIAANVVVWAVASVTGRFGGVMGIKWLESVVFDGTLAKPWTLVTSLFVHLDPLQLFTSLWLLYVIAPVLEERLKPAGVLLVYIGGGAVVSALYGSLCLTLSTPVRMAGMMPGLSVLLGVYLVLHPFEEIEFFYNIFFFVFCGTFGLATLFLVLFAIVFYGLTGLLSASILSGYASLGGGAAGSIWVLAMHTEIVLLLGLAVGFVGGVLRYGLGAFVGRGPAAEPQPVRERVLDRALRRVLKHEERRALRKATRRERAQAGVALADDAPPGQIEEFAQQCLDNQRHELLRAAYLRFRSRFPDQTMKPGLQAAIAGRLEEIGPAELAVEAYRHLIEAHGETPVGVEARLALARLLARDESSAEEAIGLLEDYLQTRPSRDKADEARGLLQRLIEETGREDTYEGLSDYKSFRFSHPPTAAPALQTPIGVPSRPAGQAIGRSAREIIGDGEGPPAPAARAPMPAREVVRDEDSQVLRAWRPKPSEPSAVAAAMTEARSFAVILLPGKSLIANEVVALLANFWSVDPSETRERLRLCRGVLAHDVPSGRAVVLTRKLRQLGLPVTTVPLLPDIVYARGEDVFEFTWTEATCGNVTAISRRSFAWEQIRLVNAARVGLPGGGAAMRFVLDVFAAQPHCWLRYWENTLHFAKSSLGDRAGGIDSLRPVIEFLDAHTPRALKPPAFLAVAKKHGAPLDFHSPTELDRYNRWFLYAGLGVYSGGE
jgi:membrane associated rhomboid family serine protease